MATLQGTKIKDTYAGILKTDNNLPFGTNGVSRIEDGDGNASALYLGRDGGSIVSGNQSIGVGPTSSQLIGDVVLIKDATNINLIQLDANSAAIGNNTNNLAFDATNGAFAGAIDFAGATVTGIDTGVQSVVAGTNVTVDNTDPANPIVNAAGGGGGSAGPTLPSMLEYPQISVTPGIAGWGFGYRGFVQYSGTLSGTDAVPAGANEAYYIPFSMTTGTVIDEVLVQIRTAGDTGDTMEIAIFDSTVINGELVPAQRLVTLGSSIPADVAGNINVTGINYTLPAPTAGCYFYGYSSNGSSFTGPRLTTAQFAGGSSLYGFTNATSFTTYGTLIKSNDRTMPDNKTTGYSSDISAVTPMILFK